MIASCTSRERESRSSFFSQDGAYTVGEQRIHHRRPSRAIHGFLAAADCFLAKYLGKLQTVLPGVCPAGPNLAREAIAAELRIAKNAHITEHFLHVCLEVLF
jgi:hypothetical protein